MAADSGLIINYIMSLLLKKVVVPAEHKDQADVVKTMLKDDVSGLVDSLTDFAVDSAAVEYSIESSNDQFSKTMKTWLDTLNQSYGGKIPMGIDALAKEYFKERWKGASFPVLRIAKWGKINGIMFPTQMYFVDGGSIEAVDKNAEEDELSLFSYDYYIGNINNEKNKLEGENVIFARPYGRWFDEYPTPYLIKRGVYHNWKIIESIKQRESDILDQIIPYILLVKKGSEALATTGTKVYTDAELQGIITQFQALIDEFKTTTTTDKSIKTPMRVTNFDEEIKHLIPDLSTIFDTKLFAQAESNILAGLGFIDIAEAVSNSRKESVLNPKVFITEVNSGVKDFKNLLKQVVELIKNKNGDDHTKYMSADFIVASTPVKSFMTAEFKDIIRQGYDRGKVSAQTYCELCPEVDFETELHRRQKEAKRGVEYIMYPQIIVNGEEKGIDIPGEETNPEDITGDNLPEDKKGAEKRQYENASSEDLTGAPYAEIGDLPASVRKRLSLRQQRAWMDIFNNALNFYTKKGLDRKAAEARAFSTAWTKAKKVK